MREREGERERKIQRERETSTQRQRMKIELYEVRRSRMHAIYDLLWSIYIYNIFQISL